MSVVAAPTSSPRFIVTILGLTQIMAWGSSYYLPAVIAPTVSADTGWPLVWIVGGLSLGLLVAGLISPRVGSAIDRHVRAFDVDRAVGDVGGRKIVPALLSALRAMAIDNVAQRAVCAKTDGAAQTRACIG